MRLCVCKDKAGTGETTLYYGADLPTPAFDFCGFVSRRERSAVRSLAAGTHLLRESPPIYRLPTHCSSRERGLTRPGRVALLEECFRTQTTTVKSRSLRTTYTEAFEARIQPFGRPVPGSRNPTTDCPLRGVGPIGGGQPLTAHGANCRFSQNFRVVGERSRAGSVCSELKEPSRRAVRVGLSSDYGLLGDCLAIRTRSDRFFRPTSRQNFPIGPRKEPGQGEKLVALRTPKDPGPGRFRWFPARVLQTGNGLWRLGWLIRLAH